MRAVETKPAACAAIGCGHWIKDADLCGIEKAPPEPRASLPVAVSLPAAQRPPFPALRATAFRLALPAALAMRSAPTAAVASTTVTAFSPLEICDKIRFVAWECFTVSAPLITLAVRFSCTCEKFSISRRDLSLGSWEEEGRGRRFAAQGSGTPMVNGGCVTFVKGDPNRPLGSGECPFVSPATSQGHLS